MATTPMTAADLLVSRLEQHGVRVVFGYPGGQLTPLYDALARRPSIRHVLARDEQAAAFMADGYARATGKPGVALAVCGPGVYNALTPLATAFTDSTPVLLISGQMAAAGLGLRSGYYHENAQLAAAQNVVKHASRIDAGDAVVSAIDEAWLAMTSGRPGPALVEIPLDVQRLALEQARQLPLPAMPAPPSPSTQDVARLADLVQSWKKPLLIAGGGVIASRGEQALAQLANRLGAPVFTSFMGKTAIASDHPLHVGLPWRKATSDLTDMGSQISPLFAQADGALAFGCRFTQAMTGNWTLRLPANLAQVDIDPDELGRHYPLVHGLAADARLTIEALLKILPTKSEAAWAAPAPAGELWRLPGLDLIGPLRRCLPRDAIVVADITRLSYMMLADFPVYQPRTFLHPAGFVAMGFGIPAALGVKVAFPDRAVVAVVGDGCFLMSGMELASAVQERLPIIVILINDRCLTLIKAIQERRYQSRFLGVDLHNPDFQKFAQAFDVPGRRAHNDQEFTQALDQALSGDRPALIEVMCR